MGSKKENLIQLLRITAMFMIMLDHLLLFVDFPLKSIVLQVANSGVFIFLFISGLLFGNRKVNDWEKWFVNRIIRICIPMWIFMVLTFVVEGILWKKFNLKIILAYLFNIQGIVGTSITGIHLWFLTLLMICYLLTPMLQHLKKMKITVETKIATVIFLIVIQVVLAYITDIGMVANHTLSWCVLAITVYVLGYYYGGKVLLSQVSCKSLLVTTVITAIISMVVLISRKLLDGSILYDRVIIFYGMIMIDIWIGVIISKISSCLKGKYAEIVINHLDKISYDIYIVHVLVITLVLQYGPDKLPILAYIIISVILSWIIANILHFVSKGIQNKLNKLTCK